MITPTNWACAIAHIDADAFYASCEAARHPELRARPICVLSNQNAMVVAKSYSAKNAGVTTGMPVWEARRLVPDAAFLTPDFRFYGQMSARMFSIMHRYSPEIEVYSIDEGFMDMNGIRTLWRKSFRQLADEIRRVIRQEVGITVSIGISTTRTLAKMASESNKPDGSTVVPGKRVERFLTDIPVQAIPGIGRNRAALLHKFNILTAHDFIRAGKALIHRLLGRHGLVLFEELNGRSVMKLETEQSLPKSMSRTASMGEVSGNARLIRAHLFCHVMRLVSDLVAKRLLTRHLQIFLTLKSFEKQATAVELDFPSNSLKVLNRAVSRAFQQLYRADGLYRGCGIVADRISEEGSATEDLFGFMREDLRQSRLMHVVNDINSRYGRGMVSLAASHGPGPNGKGRDKAVRFQYPVITAEF
ncbi:MAG: DNA polymerase IV [Mariprofundaceae bacterium]|nr:DNA polymerase IV [Mariprofundaceae bacterium]